MVKWTQKMMQKLEPPYGTTDFSHYIIHELCQLCLIQEQTQIDILLSISQKLALISNVLIRKISYAGIRCCNFFY